MRDQHALANRTNHHPSLLDIESVARRLGVSVRHIRRLVHERRIPYLKWGHLLRFDPTEIETWLNRVRRPAESDAGVDRLGA